MTVAEAAVGRRSGRLVILGVVRRGRRQRARCKCDCGAEKDVRFDSMRRGLTTSCGCYQREASARSATRHGHHRGPGYYSWQGMKARCTNASNLAYRYYGGRGITVCERWLDFSNFLADMGPRPPGHSIDRINNSGNYEPANCRWATAMEQTMNRRRRVAK